MWRDFWITLLECSPQGDRDVLIVASKVQCCGLHFVG
jgi:hypothetical protein